VKILDFGLARQTPPIEGGDYSSSPTAVRPTSPGAMLGTVGYLSPEQAKGEPADHRADIFSLGAVLYEMLVGRRAFAGRSAAELVSAVLRDEVPAPSESEPRIPKALDLIVVHCLEKRPDQRFQSARDLAFHLESLGGSVTQRGVEVVLPEPRRRRPSPVVAIVGALAALALAVGGFEAGRRASATRRGGGVVPVAFQQLTDVPGEERQARLGPDGRAFVYVSEASGNPDIYLQRVGGRNPINLTADSVAAEASPAFSPDGERLAFRSDRDGGGIFVMGSTGESVKRLTDFGHDPAWSPDGARIVFSSADGQNPWSRDITGKLWVVDVATGGLTELPTDDDAVQPSWSPDGGRIAYWGLRASSGQRDLWTVAAEPSAGAKSVAVTDDGAVDWNPLWSPDGGSLYFASERGGSMNVWRVAIEEASGRVRGEPEPVTLPSRIAGSISLSRDGAQLLFVSWDRRSTIQALGLDPAGGRVIEAPRPALRGSRVIYTQDISPDGEWIAFTNLGVREDLFVVGRDGTGYRQLTDDAFRDRGPRWSPDGERIAFYSDRSGRYDIWAIRPDGSGLEQLTKTTGESRWLPEWSPDGKRLAITNGEHTWLADLRKPLEERVVEMLPPIEGGRALMPRSWSPDGTMLAGDLDFDLSATSVTLLYSFASRTYRALPEGQGTPEWLRDGRRLLVARHDRIVLLDTGSGRATTVLETRAQHPSLSRDGRWLSYIELHSEADVWLATLGR
jgi:Tol biopolymer transport system component